MSVIKSTMTGTLSKVYVQQGERVKVGQEVAVLESMKMHIPIEADRDGVVKKVLKAEGEFINEGDVLIELE